MPHDDTRLPLILAVEADSRQARELTEMFRNEFPAELVLADSTRDALKAIGDRVPDLVLTSALIPPKDEAQLRGWLRDLGDRAAYVQTITIPALGSPKSTQASTSLATRAFSFVGGQKQVAVEPDGCDRAVFADYVALYVDLATAERHTGRRATVAASH
jgi:DNA-binding NtrC family response regulator